MEVTLFVQVPSNSLSRSKFTSPAAKAALLYGHKHFLHVRKSSIPMFLFLSSLCSRAINMLFKYLWIEQIEALMLSAQGQT